MRKTKSESMTRNPDHLRDKGANKQATRWEYNKYRATLKLDGKFFAIVTPNGKDALSQQEQNTLLDSLNK